MRPAGRSASSSCSSSSNRPISSGSTGFYSADARFKDPFNEVRGIAAISAVFRHMFDTLEQPRFVIEDDHRRSGDQCFLSWDFRFRHASACGAPS